MTAHPRGVDLPLHVSSRPAPKALQCLRENLAEPAPGGRDIFLMAIVQIESSWREDRLLCGQASFEISPVIKMERPMA